MRLATRGASTPAEIEAAFATFAEGRVGGLLVDADQLFSQRDQLASLAARHKIPTVFHVREIVEAGGLATYGANLREADRIVGTYVGRILKGDKPYDLPVQQSTKLELVVNLKTAQALGLTIPQTVLTTADAVIE